MSNLSITFDRQIGKYLLAYLETISNEIGKTKRWRITKLDGVRLGSVKWYGPWRQYCFYPDDFTIFNKACLTDIANFLEEIKNERKT